MTEELLICTGGRYQGRRLQAGAWATFPPVNILLYALAAVLAGVFAIRVPLGDRRDPARRAFGILCTTVSVTYGGFALYLLPELGWFKYVYGAGAAFLPPAMLAVVETCFVQGNRPRDRRLAQLTVLSPPIAVGFILVDAIYFYTTPRASIPEVVLTLYVFAGMLVSVHRLWDLQRSSADPAERTRIRYTLGLTTAAIGFSALETLIRAFFDEASDLPISVRPVVVQGAFPPIGSISTSFLLYFLAQMITSWRLVDMGVLSARLAAVVGAAFVLVGIDGFAAGTLFGDYPVYGFFQVFMASAIFLLAYEPLSKQLELWAGRALNTRGQRLIDALDETESGLARVISMQGLRTGVTARLLASGRVRATSLYLWDADRRAYRLDSEAGAHEEPPILQVGRQPFADGFADGPFVRIEHQHMLRTESPGSEVLEPRLKTMRAMNADVVVPFRSGDVVLGWLALRDADDVGFTEAEVVRLAKVMDRASVILENLRGFEQLKEEHRLAALGTMAAGLAHEIRNPLAGIKGAAQYLQGMPASERGGADDVEMVRVIIDEVDRLSGVVTQFLDYSRPLQVDRQTISAETLVAQIIGLLRAQGATTEIAQDHEPTPDGAPRMVDVDAGKVTQVLLNLGQNALTAAGPGGKVTFATRTGKMRDPKALATDAVEFVVMDTGVGISPADLDKLFVPFYTTRHEGTGLGLAISRRIAIAHGGELDVRSTIGVGSVFTLRVPA